MVRNQSLELHTGINVMRWDAIGISASCALTAYIDAVRAIVEEMHLKIDILTL